MALALSIEASELNEAFLWKQPEEVYVDKIKEELADIMIYAFLIADKYKLDIKDIILSKLAGNAKNILLTNPKVMLRNTLSYDCISR